MANILPFVPRTDWTGGALGQTNVIHAGDIDNLEALVATSGVYVDGFSAAGDGTTDDTTAINNALTAAASSASGARNVIFGSKTYKFSSTLRIPQGVALVGAGKSSTTLLYSGTGIAIGFTNAATTVPTVTTKATIRDLTLQGTVVATIGIDLYGSQDAYLTNVEVRDFTNQSANSGAGYRLLGYHDPNTTVNSVPCQRNRLVGCSSYNCHIGVDLYGGGGTGAYTDSYAQFNSFVSCSFTGSATPSEAAQPTYCGIQLRELARFNSFIACFVTHANGKLIEVRDNSNEFLNCSGLYSAGDGIDFTATSVGNLLEGGVFFASTITGVAISNGGTQNTTPSVGDGTGSRTSSVGGTVTAVIQDMGGEVFNALAYNGGAKTSATVNLALAAASAGGQKGTVVVSGPGWTFANTPIVVPVGCTLKFVGAAVTVLGATIAAYGSLAAALAASIDIIVIKDKAMVYMDSGTYITIGNNVDSCYLQSFIANFDKHPVSASGQEYCSLIAEPGAQIQCVSGTQMQVAILHWTNMYVNSTIYGITLDGIGYVPVLLRIDGGGTSYGPIVVENCWFGNSQQVPGVDNGVTNSISNIQIVGLHNQNYTTDVHIVECAIENYGKYGVDIVGFGELKQIIMERIHFERHVIDAPGFINAGVHVSGARLNFKGGNIGTTDHDPATTYGIWFDKAPRGTDADADDETEATVQAYTAGSTVSEFYDTNNSGGLTSLVLDDTKAVSFAKSVPLYVQGTSFFWDGLCTRLINAPYQDYYVDRAYDGYFGVRNDGNPQITIRVSQWWTGPLVPPGALTVAAVPSGGLGDNPPPVTISPNSNAAGGYVAFGTGATNYSFGQAIRVNFPITLPALPRAVLFTPGTQATSGIGLAWVNQADITYTSFIISIPQPAGNQTQYVYGYYYIVVY